MAAVPPPTSPEEQNAKMAMKQMRIDIKRLLDSWDPLCMKGMRGFEMQYSEQVGPIAVMVKKRATPMEIARHLQLLLVRDWGLPDDRAKCLALGEKMHRCGMFLDK